MAQIHSLKDLLENLQLFGRDYYSDPLMADRCKFLETSLLHLSREVDVHFFTKNLPESSDEILRSLPRTLREHKLYLRAWRSETEPYMKVLRGLERFTSSTTYKVMCTAFDDLITAMAEIASVIILIINSSPGMSDVPYARDFLIPPLSSQCR